MNLDTQKLKEALEEVPIVEANAEAACYKLLDMILAYDDGAVCGSELLQCCLLIAEKLCGLEGSSEAYRVNRAQILKRMDKMTAEIEDDLREIALSSQSDQAKASAYILLNDHAMAEKCIKNIPEQARAEFEKWPIVNPLNGELSAKQAFETKGTRAIKIMQRKKNSST